MIKFLEVDLHRPPSPMGNESYIVTCPGDASGPWEGGVCFETVGHVRPKLEGVWKTTFRVTFLDLEKTLTVSTLTNLVPLQ